jgi:hypothetical protein
LDPSGGAKLHLVSLVAASSDGGTLSRISTFAFTPLLVEDARRQRSSVWKLKFCDRRRLIVSSGCAQAGAILG